MVAVRSGIVAEEVPLNAGKNGKVVCATLHMQDSPPLYICAYCRPPKDTTDALDSLGKALDELQPRLDEKPSHMLAGCRRLQISWYRLGYRYHKTQ